MYYTTASYIITECSTILLSTELLFRFESAAYNVSEGAGHIILCIVFSGDAGEFVPHVTTSTVDGTATGNNTMTFLM